MEYIPQEEFDINKGMIADALGYQETEISGKEMKELASKKASQLEAKMLVLDTVASEILKDCRVQPNKPMSEWELEGSYLPVGDVMLFSWELCNFSQDIGFQEEYPSLTAVSYNPKNSDYKIAIDDFPVSEGEKEQRMRYNETMREWVSTRKDWVMLRAFADHHDEKQKVKMSYRLLALLKN